LVGWAEDRIGVERGWIGGRFRVLVCTGTGSDKITSSGTRQQERHELEQVVWVSPSTRPWTSRSWADVLPDSASVAKDLGVTNIAGALPFSIGPALAPMVLAADGGSYALLSAVVGAYSLASAGAILRVRQVR
jgi:hypothetical protein